MGKKDIKLINENNETLLVEKKTTHLEFVDKFSPLFEKLKKIGSTTYKAYNEADI